MSTAGSLHTHHPSRSTHACCKILHAQGLASQQPSPARAIYSPGKRRCAAGDRKWAPQKQALAGGVDMVVGTPGRVLSHVQAGTLNLQHCHTVVIDEVDVLLGDQHAFSAQVAPAGCVGHVLAVLWLA